MKHIILIISVLMLIFILSACAPSNQSAEQGAEGQKTQDIEAVQTQKESEVRVNDLKELIIDDKKRHLGNDIYKPEAGNGAWVGALEPEGEFLEKDFFIDKLPESAMLQINTYSSELTYNDIFINNEKIGSLCLTDEFGWKVCEIELPAGIIKQGSNKIKIIAAKNRPDNNDDLMINGVKIQYN